MRAVTTIAKAPPIVTRTAARPIGAPPRWPPNPPTAARLISDDNAIEGMRRGAGAMRSARPWFQLLRKLSRVSQFLSNYLHHNDKWNASGGLA